MTKNVYWISGVQPHRIAIVARPRGDDWLFDDIQSVAREGINVLVSMLTPEEAAELGLAEEERACDHCGITFFNVPIPDRSVPDEDVIRDFLDLLVRKVRQGRSLGFHCRAGIGRSAMLAALLMTRLGWTAEAAFREIEKSRGCRVPDTLEQEESVKRFVRRFAK